MAKNEKDQQPPEGLDQQNQQLSQQDLERMMKDLENSAKSGSRDQAQQMLAQMRDLLERLQSGQQMSKKDAERGQMMMKKLDELGGVIGQQQRLMDETYSAAPRSRRSAAPTAAIRKVRVSTQQGQQGGQRGPVRRGLAVRASAARASSRAAGQEARRAAARN